jgi:glycerophosphoryl diester phosphodiesterase
VKSYRPLVFGHRGAPGYVDENTLASFARAIELGADGIEFDLVPTRDGVLVVRHEPELSETTDVADHPEFADRHTTLVIDGKAITGWFTHHFDYEELRRLRAKERIPHLRPGNTRHDRRYKVPTFQDALDLVRRMSRNRANTVELAVEVKHLAFFAGEGVPIEPALLETLERNGLNRPDSGVRVSSFDVGPLQALAAQLDLPVFQNIDWPELTPPGAPDRLEVTNAELVTEGALDRIATYAAGIVPEKGNIIPRDEEDNWLAPTDLVSRAHKAGLQVCPFTFRAENEFLPRYLRSGPDPSGHGDAIVEYLTFFALGVDGVFSDQPDLALAARRLAV